jgi:hypothetical protein
MKHINMYSGGRGSWLQSVLLTERYGAENVLNLFTDTLIEDEDTYRFIDETTKQSGIELVRLEDGRTPWEVFKDVKWIGNSRLAQCSHLLKQKPSRKWIEDNYKPDEVTLYVGIDWTEDHRMPKIVENWEPYHVTSLLLDPPYMDKVDVLKMMKFRGIEPPRLYAMGFSHNNCGGFCVRGGQAHFINLLKTKRDLYLFHENEEEKMRQYLGRDDVSILTRVVGEEKQTLTMRQLREEWENGLGMQIDMFDIGGCGCFTA